MFKNPLNYKKSNLQTFLIFCKIYTALLCLKNQRSNNNLRIFLSLFKRMRNFHFHFNNIYKVFAIISVSFLMPFNAVWNFCVFQNLKNYTMNKLFFIFNYAIVTKLSTEASN